MKKLIAGALALSLLAGTAAVAQPYGQGAGNGHGRRNACQARGSRLRGEACGKLQARQRRQAACRLPGGEACRRRRRAQACNDHDGSAGSEVRSDHHLGTGAEARSRNHHGSRRQDRRRQLSDGISESSRAGSSPARFRFDAANATHPAA